MQAGKKLGLIMFGLGWIVCLPSASVSAGIYESVNQAENTIQNISSASFSKVDLQTVYLKDLEGIHTTLNIAEAETETASRNQHYQDTLSVVNNLILKTDGCSLRGNPDTGDWIITCADASQAYTALTQLATDINALIQ